MSASFPSFFSPLSCVLSLALFLSLSIYLSIYHFKTTKPFFSFFNFCLNLFYWIIYQPRRVISPCVTVDALLHERSCQTISHDFISSLSAGIGRSLRQLLDNISVVLFVANGAFGDWSAVMLCRAIVWDVTSWLVQYPQLRRKYESLKCLF